MDVPIASAGKAAGFPHTTQIASTIINT